MRRIQAPGYIIVALALASHSVFAEGIDLDCDEFSKQLVDSLIKSALTKVGFDTFSTIIDECLLAVVALVLLRVVADTSWTGTTLFMAAIVLPAIAHRWVKIQIAKETG